MDAHAGQQQQGCKEEHKADARLSKDEREEKERATQHRHSQLRDDAMKRLSEKDKGAGRSVADRNRVRVRIVMKEVARRFAPTSEQSCNSPWSRASSGTESR